MAVTHQPKTLAVLISLIGAAASPAALAYTEVEVPAATALDITRWSPGLVWRDSEHGAGRPAPAADDFGLPEPVLVALPVRKPEPEAALLEQSFDVQVSAADPGIAEVHPDPEPRPHAIRRLIDRFSAKLLPASALEPALPIVRESGLAPTSTAPVADFSSVHAEWLMKDLADILPSGVQGSARQQLLAQVAKRFPAAVEAPAQAEAARARGVLQRDGFTPRIERQEVVVASHVSKVMRNLDSILSDGVAPADERVVNTHAERVLAAMMELSVDRKVHKVEAKRQARRAARALEAEAAAKPPPPLDIELPSSERLAADRIDIRLDELPAMAELPGAMGSRVAAVNDASLDRVRGGFVGNGLNVSFGIERAAYVNGVLVATTSLNVSELGRITGGSGTAALDSGKLALIQSGAGNLVSVGSISPTSVGTVVQNAIDGQKIQNVTVINATVNSLGVLRGLDLQSSLRGAVVDSLRR